MMNTELKVITLDLQNLIEAQDKTVSQDHTKAMTTLVVDDAGNKEVKKLRAKYNKQAKEQKKQIELAKAEIVKRVFEPYQVALEILDIKVKQIIETTDKRSRDYESGQANIRKNNVRDLLRKHVAIITKSDDKDLIDDITQDLSKIIDKSVYLMSTSNTKVEETITTFISNLMSTLSVNNLTLPEFGEFGYDVGRYNVKLQDDLRKQQDEIKADTKPLPTTDTNAISTTDTKPLPTATDEYDMAHKLNQKAPNSRKTNRELIYNLLSDIDTICQELDLDTKTVIDKVWGGM